MTQSKAWSRMFALCASAFLVMTSLGSQRLLAPSRGAPEWWRRMVSRRRGRCEQGLSSAMVSLRKQDKAFYHKLCPHAKLRLEATLANVS